MAGTYSSCRRRGRRCYGLLPQPLSCCALGMLPCCGAVRCLELEFVWRETVLRSLISPSREYLGACLVGRVWYSLPPDKALPWTWNDSLRGNTRGSQGRARPAPLER